MQNSVRYREVSIRFFPDWIILLLKPALECYGIMQSTPKCVKRPVLGDGRA